MHGCKENEIRDVTTNYNAAYTDTLLNTYMAESVEG